MWPNKLYFSTLSFLQSTDFFYRCCIVLIPPIKTVTNSRYNIIMWTFQPTLIVLLVVYILFPSVLQYLDPISSTCPVGWGCRIHWLHLCRGVKPPPNECPGYDTKQSDGEVPAVLELRGMRSTPSLPLLPGPLWPRVVAPDRALSMG